MSIELYNEDCMIGMSRYPDKHFQLSIVDPPYGIGMNAGNGNYSQALFKKDKKTWDSERPQAAYFDELQRVSQNRIIWGANYFVGNLEPSMGWIVWYKTDECKGRDFGECEFAYSSFDRAARHFEEKPFQRNGTRIHPTQKPVKLYKWLLTNYAKQGDKILDTHGGSMSIALACHQLKFDLTLFEIDKDYFEAGKKRLKDFQMQGELW